MKGMVLSIVIYLGVCLWIFILLCFYNDFGKWDINSKKVFILIALTIAAFIPLQAYIINQIFKK